MNAEEKAIFEESKLINMRVYVVEAWRKGTHGSVIKIVLGVYPTSEMAHVAMRIMLEKRNNDKFHSRNGKIRWEGTITAHNMCNLGGGEYIFNPPTDRLLERGY
jgi:hypothetical protein